MQLPLIKRDNPSRGIVLMLISVFFFALMNASVKYLSDHINVFQISFFRCLFAMIPTVLAVAMTTGFHGLKTNKMRGHLFRAATGTVSMVTFFFTFTLLPLADAVALNFTGPLFLTVLSLFILKEQLERIQWACLLFGFIGILIVVRVWEGGTEISLLGIFVGFINAIFYALSMIGVRTLGRTEAPTTTVFYFMLITTVITALPMPFFWHTPTANDALILFLSGLLGGVGQLVMTRAFQYAPAGIVSPYGYSSILWAMLFGYLFWNEVPSWAVFVGGGIVILSELAVYYVKSDSTLPKRPEMSI